MLKSYRTAVVTGASRGIGPYIARALAQEGLNLVLAARSAEEPQRVAGALSADGARRRRADRHWRPGRLSAAGGRC